mmetsp:Transcript_55849/g.149122  ORF Transcript_55849/g.149122 Transcript_55849/m.149122 type:complete len:112 (-) Transcript_55849:44-379(-)
MIVIVSVQSTTFGQSRLPVGTLPNYFMRAAMVGFTIFIALLTESFLNVFSLVSSIFGPLMNVFFIFIFGRRIQERFKIIYPSWRRGCHVLICLFGAFCLVFGFIDSVMAFL